MLHVLSVKARLASTAVAPTRLTRRVRDNMKKILLCTSALALAGAFASPAASAEWEVRVGGYMEQFVAFATSSGPRGGVLPGTDFDGIDSKQDAEIAFIPSITLDNGIKIGANIQLEGFASTGTADLDAVDARRAFTDNTCSKGRYPCLVGWQSVSDQFR